MAKKYDVAILDGNNMFFKAFSIHKSMYTRVGDKIVQTGGAFGLIQSILTITKDYLKEDGSILIAWDKGHTRRTIIYPEYKANRNKDEWEERDNFNAQMKLAKYVIDVIGIRQAFKNGEEADDIVGTLSRLQSENGKEVILISADKDFQQLIDDSVDLLAHKTASNKMLWNTKNWTETRGYDPKLFKYFLALNGDAGDNIPGILGIGLKAADNFIINNFDLIEAMIENKPYEHLIPAKKTAALEKLLNGVKDFRLSYSLAEIDKNVNGIRIVKNKKNIDKMEDVFNQLKFESFLNGKNWELLGVL